ncbi:MAG TPA: methylmalonyl Co-A mutase-associated GTPase MeaB [Anaerolineae bacterium]|nr:methylmalonyl Co-A mutase-associated GTPase MeaB [Anaerolineae bacterium]HIQ04455.1 methylmalonyl Co-A mutase-associated GTPase MeaB [Anaerolineae bacterium]
MELVTQLLEGNRRALARAISLVEDRDEQAQELLSELYPHTGRAHIIGITGAPGTGKSTLVNALAKQYRQRGVTVGIVAVDPTSPFTGGALLGDRVRMQDLAGDPGVFIRSMATRGSLGGLAMATADVVLVLDAAGFQRILVETVGVGQAEVDIASTAHTTVVVEAPGMGDEVQAIKAGVLEIADIFAVNKADRDNAERTALALEMMLGLAPVPSGHHGYWEASVPSASARSWRPPIHKTIALRGEGVEALLEAIEAHIAYLRESGQLAQREQARVTATIEHILHEALLQQFMANVPAGCLEALIEQVTRREMNPYDAVARLLSSAGHPQAICEIQGNREYRTASGIGTMSSG